MRTGKAFIAKRFIHFETYECTPAHTMYIKNEQLPSVFHLEKNVTYSITKTYYIWHNILYQFYYCFSL